METAWNATRRGHFGQTLRSLWCLDVSKYEQGCLMMWNGVWISKIVSENDNPKSEYERTMCTEEKYGSQNYRHEKQGTFTIKIGRKVGKWFW